MNYLRKIGMLFAMVSVLVGLSMSVVSAQDERRDDRNMQSMHHDNNGRRRMKNRKNWYHNAWKHRRHYRHHDHHTNYIRRDRNQ